MSALIEEQCFLHVHREAVARCPQCRNFFCRECITEHDGRIICASCLGGLAKAEEKPPLRITLMRPTMLLASCLFLWTIFFLFGRSLLMLPDSFHEGTVWTAPSAFDFDEDDE